jgi:hypothetical protein
MKAHEREARNDTVSKRSRAGGRAPGAGRNIRASTFPVIGRSSAKVKLFGKLDAKSDKAETTANRRCGADSLGVTIVDGKSA